MPASTAFTTTLGSPPALATIARIGDSSAFSTSLDTYGGMIEMVTLDPTKVTSTALQNAASVASLKLTTEAMIAQAPRDETPARGGGMGGMGM